MSLPRSLPCHRFQPWLILSRFPSYLLKFSAIGFFVFATPYHAVAVSSCKLYDMLRYGYPLRSCLWVSLVTAYCV